MTATIRLYAGAHKTASTHLQDLLLCNSAAVGEAGTRILDPVTLRRSGWMMAFNQAVKQFKVGKPIDAELMTTLRDAVTRDNLDCLLMEENILGTPRTVLFRNVFYEEAGPRLATLRHAFADRPIEVFVSLRSYDSFFSSMYAEIVRNRGYFPFETFRQALEKGQWSWLDTVGELVATFGAAQVTLWDFADFRPLLPRLVALMSGVEDSTPLIAAYPSKRTRPSLSQTTMDLLKALTPVFGPEETLAMTEKINARYGVERGEPAFMPYAEAERQALGQRYQRDLATIRDRWPDVTLLTAPPAAAAAPVASEG